jgi:hypothetical protein
LIYQHLIGCVRFSYISLITFNKRNTSHLNCVDRYDGKFVIALAFKERNNMKKVTKNVIVSFGAAALLLAGGIETGYAASNWQGHANMVQTESNLDELATQLSKDKTALTSEQQALQKDKNDQADLQKKLAEAESEEKALQDQHTKDQADIQQKIKEKNQGILDQVNRGNERVNEKQKEVDALEKKVSDLSNQLAKQKPSDSDTAQAIQDAQDLRDKSDRLVNQYVEK